MIDLRLGVTKPGPTQEYHRSFAPQATQTTTSNLPVFLFVTHFSSLSKLCTILILVHNFFVFQVEETCCCCLRRPRWLFRLGGATKAIHSIVKPCWREVAPPVALVRTSAFPRVTRANQRFVSNTIPIPSSKDCISVFEGSKSFATNDWCSRGLLVWMVAGRQKTGQTDGPTKRAAGRGSSRPSCLS